MRSPSPSRDQQRVASALELRMKEHDYETETLTDHQRRSRDVMSRKMAEMTKLQGTLTNQAKVNMGKHRVTLHIFKFKGEVGQP